MSRIDSRHWLWCPEFIPNIQKFLAVTIFKMATTIPHKFNIVRFQRNFICRQIMMSWIDSRHRKISTCLHFQNGHQNTAKILHCSISKVSFDLFFKPVVSGRFGRLHNNDYNHILFCTFQSCICNWWVVLFCNFSPVFDGMFDFCSMYTGASLEGAIKLNNNVSHITKYFCYLIYSRFDFYKSWEKNS